MIALVGIESRSTLVRFAIFVTTLSVLTQTLVYSPALAGPIDLSTGSAGFGNTLGPGIHTDLFTFTLATTAVVNSSIISVLAGNRDLDFISASITGPTAGQYSEISSDPFEVVALPTSGITLTAGSYTLALQVQVGAGGGAYGGNLAVTPLRGTAPTNDSGTNTTGVLDLSAGSAAFFNTPKAGSFTDTFSFSLAIPSFLSGGVTTARNGAQNVGFSDVTVVGANGENYAFSQTLTDPIETLVRTNVLLPAGQYRLMLKGENSLEAGSYGGNISLSPIGDPIDVPEPATWLLLLVGLFAAGIGSLRRGRFARECL